MSEYFPKPFKSFRGDIKVKVDPLIMQQKLLLKTLLMWILRILHQKQI